MNKYGAPTSSTTGNSEAINAARVKRSLVIVGPNVWLRGGL